MTNNNAPSNQYIYWVTYYFGNGSRSGFGGGRVYSSAPANTLTWLESVRDWILQQDPQYGEVLIINWHRLEGDEYWDAATRHPA